MAKWIQAHECITNEKGEVVPYRDIEGRHQCSNCHSRAFYNEDSYHDEDYLTPYCPMCGSKMENPNVDQL